MPISAKEGINLKLLEKKIHELAERKVNLLEDHGVRAQCITIESNVDERSGQLTASVLVRKGVLRLNDAFVCGVHEGRVKNMKDDNGLNVTEAFPGQAVHLSGFR